MVSSAISTCVPEHRLGAMRRKLQYLERYRAALVKASPGSITKVADQVAAAIRREDPKAQVSAKSLYRWDKLERERGPMALVDPHGLTREPATPTQSLESLPTCELVRLASACLTIIASRQPADVNAN